MMYNMTDKYAVVTGAGQGIGRVIAARLLQDGMAGVALLDYNEPLVTATAAELDPTGERAFPVACDVSNEEAVADDTEVVVINGGVNIFTFILLGAIAITIIIILILLRERRRK